MEEEEEEEGEEEGEGGGGGGGRENTITYPMSEQTKLPIRTCHAAFSASHSTCTWSCDDHMLSQVPNPPHCTSPSQCT